MAMVKGLEVLDAVLSQAQVSLKDFIDSPHYLSRLTLAFGSAYKLSEFQVLAAAWRQNDFSMLPSIEIRQSREINGAIGAYSQDTGKVYLAQELVSSGNERLLLSVLLEELGHFIDAHINEQEAPGDEGALFALLAQGIHPSQEQVAALKAEDDWARICLDGRWIAIEQANYTGTPGDDTLPPAGADNSGNDDLYGLEGNDSLFGGAGNDIL